MQMNHHEVCGHSNDAGEARQQVRNTKTAFALDDGRSQRESHEASEQTVEYRAAGTLFAPLSGRVGQTPVWRNRRQYSNMFNINLEQDFYVELSKKTAPRSDFHKH